jgi:aerobic carbon-monoxide dehydrogenase small subunit
MNVHCVRKTESLVGRRLPLLLLRVAQEQRIGPIRDDRMPTHPITVEVNDKRITADVEPRLLLVYFLRELAGLTGTHIGCDTSQCGACTVRMDKTNVKSCTVLAVQADGHSVTTIEGLSRSGLTPLQQAFHEKHALQCGFCTPGMIFAAQALLDRIPNPTEAQVRHALHANLCRCTGYQNIVDAVLMAARHESATQTLAEAS